MGADLRIDGLSADAPSGRNLTPLLEDGRPSIPGPVSTPPRARGYPGRRGLNHGEIVHILQVGQTRP